MSEPFKSLSGRKVCTPSKLPQRERLDKAVRAGLWNAFYANFPRTIDSAIRDYDDPVIFYSNPIYQEVFARFLKNPIDEYEDNADEDECYIKAFFLNQEWNKVLDLVDFVMHADHKQAFVDECKTVLEQENTAYSIVGKCVVEITSKQEVAEIEAAMQIPFDEARKCIENALRHFSDRENPDYKNSIAESIHAVESIAQEVTGKKDALNAMTQSLKLHPNLTNALNELYNWTSKDGIRHGKSSKPLSVNQATARFMLVTCSAFVNCIIAGSPE